eukprot:11842754-Alexandrium_andersonii.AAC.1
MPGSARTLPSIRNQKRFLLPRRGLPANWPRNASVAAVKEAFATAWPSWAGTPQAVMADRGKELARPMPFYFQQHGAGTDFASLET